MSTVSVQDLQQRFKLRGVFIITVQLMGFGRRVFWFSAALCLLFSVFTAQASNIQAVQFPGSNANLFIAELGAITDFKDDGGSVIFSLSNPITIKNLSAPSNTVTFKIGFKDKTGGNADLDLFEIVLVKAENTGVGKTAKFTFAFKNKVDGLEKTATVYEDTAYTGNNSVIPSSKTEKNFFSP